MMRRRAAVGLLAGVLLAGLVAVPGAPAGAQDISDLPRLGYEINPTEGNVGDEVHSQVNPADVNEHCWDTALSSMPGEELFAGFMAGEVSLEELLTTFAFEFGMYVAPGAYYWDFLPQVAPAGGYTVEEAHQIWESIYGPPPADVNDNPISTFISDSRFAPPPEGIPDDELGQHFVDRLGDFVVVAFGPFGVGELAPQLYPQFFITTFVDPVTQELLGETGNFDPGTGEGTMLVPDLDPALYAVVAACVTFGSPEEFMASWAEAQVAAWDYSIACVEAGDDNCWPGSGFPEPSDHIEWAAQGGFAALLVPLLEPRAVGIDFYCILQDDGYCATPPGPVGLIDDEVIDEFNGDDPLAPGPGAEDLDDASDLVAVQATPSFTG